MCVKVRNLKNTHTAAKTYINTTVWVFRKAPFFALVLYISGKLIHFGSGSKNKKVL